MKNLTLATLTLLFSSCNPNSPRYSVASSKLSPDIHYGVNTIVHDSCEYVIYSGSQKGGIIHKGNCKFCKQRNTIK